MADAKSAAGDLAVAQLLVACGRDDTAYRDVYLAAAAAHLAQSCSAAEYAALRRLETQRDMALQQSRVAVLENDWVKVGTAAAQAEAAQQRLDAQAAAMELAAEVYDHPPLRVDPFSPGVGLLLDPGVDPVDVRRTLLDGLTRLATVDAARAPFYAARRAYFDGLQVATAVGTTAAPVTADPAQLQRQAYAAAQRGDAGRLRELAQALQQVSASAPPAGETGTGAPTPAHRARCPIDLSADFPADAVQRAQGLGLAAVESPPALDENRAVIEYAHLHAWQPVRADAAGESGGSLRLQRELSEAGVAASVAQDPLVPQFLSNTFVTSAGTRYLLAPGAEALLLEDFDEAGEVPNGGPLLTALGLPQRVGLSRATIETALQAHGAEIVATQLGLDPIDYRLVCVPWDHYLRVGRARGWGQQQRWTHFDGYQVLRNRSLRALAGGDVRYGGLRDLVSLSPTDAREGVVARFAVVRRARLISRW